MKHRPRLEVCPMTLREARAYVQDHHRHHRAPVGGKFAIGAIGGTDFRLLVGVVIVGRPVSRCLQNDPYTAEVIRLCTVGAPNACSFLYAAAWRAARAMGYRRLVTYTLPEEGGSSLRGAGWRLVGETRGGRWARAARPRVDDHPTQAKLRWEMP